MAKNLGRRMVEVAAAAALAAGGAAGCSDEAPRDPNEHVIVVTSPANEPTSPPPDVSDILVRPIEEKVVGEVNKAIILGATCLIEEAPEDMKPTSYDTVSNKAAAVGEDGIRGTKDDSLVVEVGRDRGSMLLSVTITDEYRGRLLGAVMASDQKQPAFAPHFPDVAPPAASLGSLMTSLEATSTPIAGRTTNEGLTASLSRENPSATTWTLYNETDERFADGTGARGATAWAAYTMQTGGEMMVDHGYTACGPLSSAVPNPDPTHGSK